LTILGACFHLSSNEKEKSIKIPPSNKIVAYWCALITVLSAMLMLLVAPDPLSLTSYSLFTLVLTVIVFRLRLRFLFQTEKSESSEEQYPRGQSHSILLILAVIAFMAMPIILLYILPALSWFIFLNVLVSGISLSEVALFYYTRRH
jgi:hypothetical protein